MGKGQGTEWERVGHILIGLGHYDNIGSLRSQSLLCKNKHLSLSCLGKNRGTPLARGCLLYSSGFVLLPWQLLRLGIPVNRTDPSKSVQHFKEPLCYCFDLCNTRRNSVGAGASCLHLRQMAVF